MTTGVTSVTDATLCEIYRKYEVFTMPWTPRGGSHASTPKYIVNTKYLRCCRRRAKRLMRLFPKYIVSAKQKGGRLGKADNHGRRKQKIKEMDSIRKKNRVYMGLLQALDNRCGRSRGLCSVFHCCVCNEEDKPILDVLVNNYDDVSEDCRLTQGICVVWGRKSPGRVTFDNNAFFNLAK